MTKFWDIQNVQQKMKIIKIALILNLMNYTIALRTSVKTTLKNVFTLSIYLYVLCNTFCSKFLAVDCISINIHSHKYTWHLR